MRLNKIIFVMTTLGLILVYCQGSSAEDSNMKKGLTFTVGLYSPSLKMSTDDQNYLQGSSYSNSTANLVLTGDNPEIASFGIGVITRSESGAGSRLLYQYRQESDMIYDQASSEDVEYTFPQNDQPILRNIMHTLSLSAMWHSQIVRQVVSIYIGGGVNGVLLFYPGNDASDEHSIGITGFPLGGLEFMFTKNIGFYAEYQYHWGQTFEQTVKQTQENAGVENHCHYSLQGQNIIGGINLFF